MRFILFKTLAIIIIVLITASNIFPYSINNSVAKEIENNNYNSIFLKSDINQELNLLYGKTILYLYALEDVDKFNVIFSVPPNYENQVPILFNIRDETTANILSYRIYNDTNQPNKVINFTVGSLNKKQTFIISFEYWVLIENNDYKDLPDYVEMPSDDKLPDNVKIWLQSTEAIQSDHPLIKLKANQLLKKSNNNLRTFADNIVNYTRRKYNLIREITSIGKATILYHLFPWKFPGIQKILLQIGNIKIICVGGAYKDALSVMILGGGGCDGTANLGTALFRAAGIPAKQLILTPLSGRGENEYCWYHCICEYYCPDYGWVWAETTVADTPRQPKDAVVLRVNYPEDENNAGKRLQDNFGHVYSFWVINNNIIPDSRTWGWNEKNLTADKNLADDTFNLTQNVWELFTQYIGRLVNSEDINKFNSAVTFQTNAIECFKQSDVIGYFNNMTDAYNEYKEIEHP
jgi:transglutaminase-like putative cysteine protease